MRPWRPEDLFSLVRHANDRQIWLNVRDLFPHPYRMEDGRAWLAHVAYHDPPTAFAIECEGLAVGGVGVVPGADVERISGEIGFWVGREFWGRGLATAAVREITAYAFDSLGLLRIFATPFERNAASVRVLEKAGYRLEGRLLESALKDGRLETQLLYALTRTETLVNPG